MEYKYKVVSENGEVISFDVVEDKSGLNRIVTSANKPWHEIPVDVRKAMLAELIMKKTEEP